MIFFVPVGLGKQCRPRSTAPDQGLNCLQFRLHRLDLLLYGKAILFKPKGDYNNVLDVRIFRTFTVF